MNGDTNGTMGEPMDTAVLNEHNTIPDVKIVNPENLANGVNCDNDKNSNDIEIKNLDTELKDSVKAMDTDSVPLGKSQDNLTNNPDDFSKTIQDVKGTDLGNGSVDSPDRKPIIQQDFSDLNNETHINNGVPEEKVTSEQSFDNKAESMKEEMLCHEVKNSEHSLELSNDININKNNGLSEKQENCKNSVDSNNSSDDSSDSEEDTAGDTMSGDDNGKDMGGIIKHKYDDGDSKTETFKIVTIDQHHSDQEAASINLSDYSASDGELKAEDTVSIDSDSGDDSLEASGFNKSNESIIIIENEGTGSHNRASKTIEVEVHEIVSDNDNDDCVVTSEGKPKTTGYLEFKKKKGSKGLSISKADNQIELRRSSRAIKRKKYDVDIQPMEDESDVEEVVLEDPLRRKSRYVNSKSIVDTSSKHGKTTMNKKKEINVVIIDSPVVKPSLPPPNKSAANTSLHQNIYQTISSRGTSVTPITVKSTNSQSTQACQTSTPPLPPLPPPPPILPTLTDDMFVVEAPSFIVPYVYEKPAEVPFKEFVDKWGKELAEEKAKEDHAVLEKKKEEKAKREQDKKEKKERGEEVEESEEEVESEEVKKKKAEKAEKRERRRRKKEDDDVSWDGSSTEESEDDTISDDDSQTTILKDKADIIEEIKEIGEIVPDATPKSESYFDLFLGKFFMNIGLNLVQEYVQTDLLNQQKRKLQREKKGGHDTQDRLLSIALLTKNLELSQKTNASLTFQQKKCGFCSFNTESALALAHHLETPHMKNNMYTCNYCPFETRSPHDILFHMEKGHGVKARLERALGSHQCANCPFEDNGKGKLARHIVACTKKFKPEINLAPPAEWEHPAKIAKLSRARQNMVPYQVTSQFGRHHVDGTGFTKVPIPIGNAMPPMGYRPRTRVANPRAPLNIPAQMRPSGVLIRQAPSPHPTYPPGNAKKTQPSLSITPLPRQQVPVPVQPLHAANAKGFVICEICDGYIKDLEQLRNHMQWIHKVKIHPKMIYNRPPLNCQKCQFRFFTDQGLERHLLGSHGLVTSSMQEAANKGKDAGRCPVCGRVYQWKLLSHVSRDHNLILKPAHLSYKCTVCTATFGMYRQFENHVYSAHSVVAKKVMDKKTTAQTTKGNANDNAAKQLKINNEITITPQPMKMPAPNKG